MKPINNRLITSMIRRRPPPAVNPTYTHPMLVRRLEESTSSSPDWGRVDQFHIGGKVTTNKFLKWLEVGGKKVLDVGCGLGGPARMCIDPPHGCESVIGVDTFKVRERGA